MKRIRLSENQPRDAFVWKIGGMIALGSSDQQVIKDHLRFLGEKLLAMVLSDSTEPVFCAVEIFPFCPLPPCNDNEGEKYAPSDIH